LKKLQKNNIVQIAEQKSNSKIDPDVQVEQELLRCFKIIEESSITLSKVILTPVLKQSAEVSDQKTLAALSNLDTSIFESATTLVKAASNLVQSSVAAQRERAKEKQTNQYRADPIWANGLISASQKVALSVQELVSCANLLATAEKGEEEALIAAARGVASSTAQLVFASKAKGDPNSKAQLQIQASSKAVASSAAKLTSAAGERGLIEERTIEKANPATKIGNIFFEMEQNIKIQNLEKQLEQELQKQRRMNQLKYAKNKNIINI